MDTVVDSRVLGAIMTRAGMAEVVFDRAELESAPTPTVTHHFDPGSDSVTVRLPDGTVFAAPPPEPDAAPSFGELPIPARVTVVLVALVAAGIVVPLLIKLVMLIWGWVL
jgi:hypothetical protein